MSNNRSWMYQRINNQGYLNSAFVKGLEELMNYVKSQPTSMDGTNIKCPCSTVKIVDIKMQIPWNCIY